MDAKQPLLPWFVEQMQEYDTELYRMSADSAQTALSEGVLDYKTKCLIVLALDVLKGAPQGVKVVAQSARAAGATPAEIAEAIRLAYYVNSMDVIRTGLSAFEASP